MQKDWVSMPPVKLLPNGMNKTEKNIFLFVRFEQTEAAFIQLIEPGLYSIQLFSFW